MKRDFSEAARQELLSLVSQVEDEKWCDFTDWIGDRWYDFESWIGKLDIRNYISNVNEYHKKVIDKNNATTSDINTIFENVNNVSEQYKSRFNSLLADLQEYKRIINLLATFITPNNGNFNAKFIGSGLKNAINTYLETNDELSFDDLVIPPDHVYEDIDIIGDYDITANFLDGRNQIFDAFGVAWASDWLANALSLLGIGENTNEKAVRRSIENLIANTLGNKHEASDFLDEYIKALSPEEFQIFSSVLSQITSTGEIISETKIEEILSINRELTDSEYLQWMLNADNIEFFKMLNENLDIGGYLKGIDNIDVVYELMGRAFNDYTEDLKYLELLREALIEKGNAPDVVNDVINDMISGYKNQVIDTIEYGVKKIAEKGIDFVLDTVLGPSKDLLDIFLDAKEFGCNISGLDDKTENLEIIYTTQHYSSSLVAEYENYASKIRSGRYTQEDVDKCNMYFDLARNAKIQEYEAMINIYKMALDDATIDMSSGVLEIIHSWTVSEEDKQAVRDTIDMLENEIERLESMGEKMPTCEDYGIKPGAVAGGGGAF